MILTFGLSPTGGAQAPSSLEVCNTLSYPMWVSVGFEDEGEIIAIGWNRLSAGDCHPAEVWLNAEGYSTVSIDQIWLHAADDYRDPSETFGLGTVLCVDRVYATYAVPFADSTCEKRGYDHADHSRIQLAGKTRLVLSNVGFSAL